MTNKEFQVEIWKFVSGRLTEIEADQLFVENSKRRNGWIIWKE